MAATFTETDPRQGVTPPPPDKLAAALYGDAAQPDLSTSPHASSTGEAIAGRMRNLVKGAGFVGEGANTALSDQTDILRRASQASLDLRIETRRGYAAKSSVVKSFNQDWLNSRGALKTALMQPSVMDQLSAFLGSIASPDIVRSFTAGNLGIGSTYGLTPFNLLAPSRLIYPVYTVN